ncbi:MAG TPA: hypothetical protein VG322_01640 [Candidatus Acidoferrales bacterium]|jgi:hypothetical protein|nr:hypothetical protein [Candidatus Acidoferrales bacterium]
MFCPNCKTEYRAGFSVCSDCGAQLVEHLDEAPTENPRSAGPELLWTGADAAIYGVIVNALDDAGIPHHESKREVGPIPGLGQPVYAIFIPSRQSRAAHIEMEKAVRELENDPREPEQEIGTSTVAGDSELGGEEKYASPADDIVEDYDPEQATAEVWSGSDLEIKEMLVASLRENGIGCALEVNGAFRIRVMPSDADRAREIVREVINASPPE